MPPRARWSLRPSTRGRGVSVNAVVVDALTAEIERVKRDKAFMKQLTRLTERDKEILDRLAR